MRLSLFSRALLAGSMVLLAPVALAQRGGGGGGGGRGMGGGFGGGMNGFGPGPDARDNTGRVEPLHGGLQLGPPGRWWDDKKFAKDLKLRPDQQHRMDSVFDANRAVLLRRFQDLEIEQLRMDTLVHSKSLDETTLFAQIDRISQARAELEKANTHLLLQLRGEMDPDQIDKLERPH